MSDFHDAPDEFVNHFLVGLHVYPFPTNPVSRNCLPMDDHSYFPVRSSSQYASASFHGTSSHKGAMLRMTPSLRSGSRWRSAARRSLSWKSRSSERNVSWRS